ncbi:NAD(P)H oxidase [Thalassoporum mexicanum PCC 7367]|uniref:peroxidase family protein n=1 Tax=Thalassoporum mexicanum TaxID=3457544 RepID=UPI00029FDD92|nr:peroxidase family protein [Pseudanabaena sp. PCC 7367]AFY71196.1 NAD(P)H oxidase [Pseudanabaena sp. PCC 7367]
MDTLIQRDPFASGFSFNDFPRLDGTGHDPSDPTLGGVGTRYRQLNPIDYADGLFAPAGETRPGAREISNRLMSQTTSIPDPRGLTAMSWIFGQFLNHDIDDARLGTIPFPIEVPPDDPQINNPAFVAQLGRFTRNAIDPDTGPPFNATPAAQINQATSWVDASVVYGTSEERSNAIRSFTGGRLDTSPGNLAPLDDTNLPNATVPFIPKEEFFLFGDVRGNQQLGLMAMQTVWLREHNYWADKLAEAHPDWTDEQLFQRARAIVIAEFQAVSYNEYLPAILGVENVEAYDGFDSTAVAQTSLTFATGAFRVPHSAVNETFALVTEDGTVTGEVSLFDGSFDPFFFRQGPDLVESVLRGAATTVREKNDPKYVNGLRNSFSDLGAEDIQRGRDHGLPTYNVLRNVLDRLQPTGRPFPEFTSFSQLTSDPEVIVALQDLYGDINNIDMITGMLAEELPVDQFGQATSSVGEVTGEILRLTFQRLRDGDPFYYQNPIETGGIFTDAEIQELNGTTLADIIRRTSGISNIADNVFVTDTLPLPDPNPSAIGANDFMAGADSMLLG